MLSQLSLLVRLVMLIDKVPSPPPPQKRLPGKPPTYTDKLILKALVIMIIRRLYTATALLAFLRQDDPTVRQLRELLHEDGKFPSRRTWERRLAVLPQKLPGMIGYFGRHLVSLLQPWKSHGRAASPRRHARGPSRAVARSACHRTRSPSGRRRTPATGRTPPRSSRRGSWRHSRHGRRRRSRGSARPTSCPRSNR